MKDIDHKIVTLLTQDARVPHAQIAEQVGLSRPAITERIKKLEQADVIRGYGVVLNPEAMGHTVTAFISAKHPGVLTNQVKKALMDLVERPEILEIHSIAGDDCFLIKVRTHDIESLNEAVNFLKEPPLILTTNTTIVLESYFEKVAGHVLKENE